MYQWYNQGQAWMGMCPSNLCKLLFDMSCEWDEKLIYSNKTVKQSIKTVSSSIVPTQLIQPAYVTGMYVLCLELSPVPARDWLIVKPPASSTLLAGVDAWPSLVIR